MLSRNVICFKFKMQFQNILNGLKKSLPSVKFNRGLVLNNLWTTGIKSQKHMLNYEKVWSLETVIFVRLVLALFRILTSYACLHYILFSFVKFSSTVMIYCLYFLGSHRGIFGRKPEPEVFNCCTIFTRWRTFFT